jgi:hypothetical protein
VLVQEFLNYKISRYASFLICCLNNLSSGLETFIFMLSERMDHNVKSNIVEDFDNRLKKARKMFRIECLEI